MYLKKIALLNFKNIRQEELVFCPGINALVGDNGAGKTNIIDAVYYLSMCKSALQMTDGQSIRHEADFFLVDGAYATDAGKSEAVVCSFSRKGGKILKRNGKEYERLSDHVGLIPALRKYGSQGQQKSFLIALKLAQYAIVAEEKHERPILLLDDLFDKLDAGRVEQLIRLVSNETFGQIFISDCNPTRLKRILDRAGGEYALFTVTDGAVTRDSAAQDPSEKTDQPTHE